ncbi:hypothetical protein HKX48_001877, partial [Thoreauomyces humboldtii]
RIAYLKARFADSKARNAADRAADRADLEARNAADRAADLAEIAALRARNATVEAGNAAGINVYSIAPDRDHNCALCDRRKLAGEARRQGVGRVPPSSRSGAGTVDLSKEPVEEVKADIKGKGRARDAEAENVLSVLLNIFLHGWFSGLKAHRTRSESVGELAAWYMCDDFYVNDGSQDSAAYLWRRMLARHGLYVDIELIAEVGPVAPTPPVQVQLAPKERQKTYYDEHPTCPTLDEWLNIKLSEEHKRLYALLFVLRTADRDHPLSFNCAIHLADSLAAEQLAVQKERTALAEPASNDAEKKLIADHMALDYAQRAVLRDAM